jgi:hypothetical protein
VREVVQRYHRGGGRTYLATFTIRHGAGDHLGHTAELLASAWQRMQRGRAWQEWSSGRETIRALEVTHGEHGWHPHLHVCVFSPEKMDESATADWLHARWSRCVAKVFGDAFIPSRAHGVDFRSSSVDDYVCKIGSELTDVGARKHARNGNSTPWEILARAGEGDIGDTWLWREYASAMFGRRFLTWSVGLARRRASAEAIVEAERELARLDERTVDTLSAREWDSLRDLPDFRCEILLAATRGFEPALETLREFKELRDRGRSENIARAAPS